ncbi:putative H/ACA ribonucleoprotein complex subunit 1 isoform X2 [Prunus yedoensis var. nudiflora]|uniref:Putative H/ACA ribonucleoprotein complex subunit 1 isoform X2 n=1 Tax=Prunus yedoensis var. nudiflora TaxID=2094558 RepID=A0A314UZB7_PRUYE|nr:putative H/ACA ribonucleoprotein complex subunit 1 isoform X2 [Prunus yedoensis var. nudiflora]
MMLTNEIGFSAHPYYIKRCHCFTLLYKVTLEEYEKVLEEKRKALLALKTEERKVDLDKDLKSMQQLSNKHSHKQGDLHSIAQLQLKHAYKGSR